jgi:hypothetical protein
MSRRTIGIVVLLIILPINVWLISLARRNRAANSAERNLGADSKSLDAARDARGKALIVEWRSKPAIALNSSGLADAIRGLPSNDCLPKVATELTFNSLPKEQRDDLDAAIIGFLTAYATGGSKAVTDYRRGRDQILDPARRIKYEDALAKAGQKEVVTLSDDEIFARTWEANKSQSHFESIIPASSCRRIWDARSQPLDAVLQNGKPLKVAGELYEVFRAFGGWQPNFVAKRGDLQKDLRGRAPVAIADVKLIIKLDAQFSHQLVPVFCRLWYNEAARRWQPIQLMQITTIRNSKVPTFIF